MPKKLSEIRPQGGKRDQKAWHEQVDLLELTDGDFKTVRPVGGFLQQRRHWFKSKRGKKFTLFCPNWNHETEQEEDNGCAACKEELRWQSVLIFNCIDREAQENGDTDCMRVAVLPSTAGKSLLKVMKLKKDIDPCHKSKGYDINISYDSSEVPASMYSVQGGDKTPLTDDERELEMFDIDNLCVAPPSEEIRDIVRNMKQNDQIDGDMKWNRDDDKKDSGKKSKRRDDDDRRSKSRSKRRDDEDDDYHRKKSKRDEDDDDDRGSKKSKKRKDDDDDDDRRSSKKGKSKDLGKPARKGRFDDDDDRKRKRKDDDDDRRSSKKYHRDDDDDDDMPGGSKKSKSSGMRSARGKSSKSKSKKSKRDEDDDSSRVVGRGLERDGKNINPKTKKPFCYGSYDGSSPCSNCKFLATCIDISANA
jgi:hypothetical protein